MPTSCSESQRARIYFLLSDTEKHGHSLRGGVPKTVLVLPDCSRFRRLLHSAPVLQKLQPNFSLCLWVPVAGKPSAQPSMTFFSAFFVGGRYLPVRGRVGRIWSVAFFLLEKSHGDAGTPETSWRAPSSKVFLNLACQKTGTDPGNATLSYASWHSPFNLPAFFCGCMYRLFLMKWMGNMGTWAVSGCKQVATSHLHLVKKKREEKIRQRIRVHISGHKAIRTVFPNSLKSREEAVQEDRDVAMSRGKAISSARKGEGHKQRVSGYTTLSCWSWHF